MARERKKRFGSAHDALDAWRKVCRVMGNRRGAAVRPPPAPPPSYRSVSDDVTAATYTDAGAIAPPTRRR